MNDNFIDFSVDSFKGNAVLLTEKVGTNVALSFEAHSFIRDRHTNSLCDRVVSITSPKWPSHTMVKMYLLRITKH